MDEKENKTEELRKNLLYKISSLQTDKRGVTEFTFNKLELIGYVLGFKLLSEDKVLHIGGYGHILLDIKNLVNNHEDEWKELIYYLEEYYIKWCSLGDKE